MRFPLVLLAAVLAACGQAAPAPALSSPTPPPVHSPTALPALAAPTCAPGNPIRTPPQALPPSPGGCLP